MSRIKVAPCSLSESDAFERLSAQPGILDGIRELQRVFVVGHLGAFFGDEHEKPIPRKRIVDRVRKLGRKVYIFFMKVKGDDSQHRLGMTVDTRYALGKIRRAGKKIGFGFGSGNEMFGHCIRFVSED
jgi:hypothetical protein